MQFTSRQGARLAQLMIAAGLVALAGCGGGGGSSSPGDGGSSGDDGGTTARDDSGRVIRNDGGGMPRDDAGRPLTDGRVGSGDCDIQMNAGTCSDPHTFSGCEDGVIRVSNDGQANEADPSGCATSATDRQDVVIEYTASSSGALAIETIDAVLSEIPSASDGGTVDEVFDTVIFVRSSCPGTEADEIGCDDDGSDGPRTSLIDRTDNVVVQEGDTVYIIVQGYGESDIGDTDVRITILPPCDCGARVCGENAEGCDCGDCGEAEFCTEEGQCEACDCGSRVCGTIRPESGDSCDCGDCADGEFCDGMGQCVTCECEAGRMCSDDGCGMSCGGVQCEDGEYCSRDNAGCASEEGTSTCSNTCRFAGDDDCDDGGPYADFSLCDLGTDCEDCGPR